VVGIVLGTAAPAAAHAVLLATEPVDQSRLVSPPDRVTLEFSEPVSVSAGGVRVYGGDQSRVDDGDVSTEDTVVSVGLDDEVAQGAYVVTYRVISADGHPVRGAFTFTVGESARVAPSIVAQLLSEGQDRPWEVVAAVLRFIAYAGVLMAAGGALFLTFVHDGKPDRGTLTRIVITAAVAGAAALVLGLAVRAALVTGLGPASLFRDGVMGDVMADGVGWSVAAGLAGLIAIGVGVTRSGTGARLVTCLGAVVAAGSFALTGHTRVTAPAWLATVADAVHVIAGAAWFGGLVLLAITLAMRRGRPVAERGALIVRYSGLAAWVLVAVVAAGLTLTWSEVRALRAATSTTYGWLLVAKLAVVAFVVGLAAWNRWGLLPRLAAEEDEDDRRSTASLLRRTVTAEALALIVVVALTALLVNITPARIAAGVGTTFSTTVPLGDGSVNIVVDPNRVGRNSFHLFLSDSNGQAGQVEEMTVELSLPAADIGPLQRQPVDIGSGHWLLDTSDLSIGGRWQVDVIALVDQFTEETASVEVLVNP
jgi:copper transport protein